MKARRACVLCPGCVTVGGQDGLGGSGKGWICLPLQTGMAVLFWGTLSSRQSLGRQRARLPHRRLPTSEA